MKKFSSLMLIFILLSGFFSSCKKDKGEPPLLPPSESMTIDFSNFISTGKSAGSDFDNKGVENRNWETAVLITGTWRLLMATTLAIPVAAFKVATDQDPVYLSDKTWEWNYNVSVAGLTYNARLTGQIRQNDVEWKMYVSKEGNDGYPEFLWFEGTSKLDETGGQWVLSQSAQNPEPFLQIDWTKSGTSVETIKYTYLKNDSFKNSYIEYGLTSNALNAYFTIHYFNSSLLAFSDVNIEWNTSSKNGRIRSSDYLDGEWYCWDSNRLNIVCPL